MQHAIIAQHKVIQKIAESRNCVIVGSAADYVLKSHSDIVSIFVYAPEEYHIDRVMEIYGDDREQARRNIQRSDKTQSAYYHNISGYE